MTRLYLAGKTSKIPAVFKNRPFRAVGQVTKPDKKATRKRGKADFVVRNIIELTTRTTIFLLKQTGAV